MKVQSKSKKVNKAWLNDHVNDPWVKLAQKEGYRARAAYKLREIDETLHLIKPGKLVVDLGSAPGAWSQYVRRKMAVSSTVDDGLAGQIIALDLLPMEPIEGVQFIQGDLSDESVQDELEKCLANRRADLVISDMAPNLSGIASVDAARVEHLIELVIDFCQRHLAPEGALVAKVFHGSGYELLVRLFRANFHSVKVIKPKASRDRSAETFLIGLRLRSARHA